MSSSIWEQCGAVLSRDSMLGGAAALATQKLSSQTHACPAPSLPVAAALDLIGDFRVDDDYSWPKLNVSPKSKNEDLVLHPSGAVLPSAIAQFLRPYQREGVAFIYSHYQRGQGCILADDMGLGKTVQAIAFFWVVLNKTGSRDDLHALAVRCPDSPKVLLVLPASVMYQWRAELETWMPCNVCIYHGGKPLSPPTPPPHPHPTSVLCLATSLFSYSC
jgi:SNF2 family DNA or RNA helicase